MGKLRRYLDIADETKRLYQEGMGFDAALTKAKEMYEEAQSPATNKGKEHEKSFNDIIPLGTDIDNGEVFDKITGKTVKEL